MAPKSFLLGGLKAAFSTSGRVSRAGFWGFAPFGLSLGVLAAFGAALLEFAVSGIVLSGFFTAQPLLALCWLGLQNVGVWSLLAVYPSMSLLLFFFSAAAVLALHTGASRPLASRQGDTLGGSSLIGVPSCFSKLFKFTGGKWVAVLIALISLITFLFRFVYALSNAMLPSDPKTNQYGPNPNEVTP